MTISFIEIEKGFINLLSRKGFNQKNNYKEFSFLIRALMDYEVKAVSLKWFNTIFKIHEYETIATTQHKLYRLLKECNDLIPIRQTIKVFYNYGFSDYHNELLKNKSRVTTKTIYYIKPLEWVLIEPKKIELENCTSRYEPSTQERQQEALKEVYKNVL